MAVTHTTVAIAADDPDAEVNKAEWNAAHTVADGSFAAAKLSATATDKVFGRSTAGAGNGEEIALTAAGRALIDDADPAAQRTTLGLGTAATHATGDYQPIDSDLTAIAALTTTSFGRGLLELANQAALLAAAAAAAASHTHAAGDLPDLDSLTVPSADVSMNTHNITDVVDPGSNQDAATKKYVDDSVAAGVSFGTTTQPVGTAAGGAASSASKSDHVHATGAGTPSTQAFGDAAATGTGPAASMTDHKHAMPSAVPAHGARVKRASGNFSVGNNTFTAIAFTGEDHDTDTIHDNSTNNTRLTIPSIAGVTTGLWSIIGNGYFDLAIGDLQIRIDGTTVIDFNRAFTTASVPTPRVVADWVFTAGQYIELLGRTPGGSGNVVFDAGVSPIFSIKFIGKVT